MNKLNMAKLILVELESLNSPGVPVSDTLALLKEVLRDAKSLAEQITEEEKQCVKQALKEAA